MTDLPPSIIPGGRIAPEDQSKFTASNVGANDAYLCGVSDFVIDRLGTGPHVECIRHRLEVIYAQVLEAGIVRRIETYFQVRVLPNKSPVYPRNSRD